MTPQPHWYNKSLPPPVEKHIQLQDVDGFELTETFGSIARDFNDLHRGDGEASCSANTPPPPKFGLLPSTAMGVDMPEVWLASRLFFIPKGIVKRSVAKLLTLGAAPSSQILAAKPLLEVALEEVLPQNVNTYGSRRRLDISLMVTPHRLLV